MKIEDIKAFVTQLNDVEACYMIGFLEGSQDLNVCGCDKELKILKTFIKNMKAQALDGSPVQTTCSSILLKMEELLL